MPELIVKHRPHILFLDIEMPGIDGIQLARSVDDAGPVIVFITAFSHYAARAFDVSAVDYVLKPFSDQRLREALERAKRRVRERRLGELANQVATLSAELSTETDARRPDAGAVPAASGIQDRRPVDRAEVELRSSGSRPRTTTCSCTPSAAATW